MSVDFRFSKGENINDGVRRIMLSLNDKAIDHITSSGNPHEAVHKLRKRFKEIRALLRLIRNAIGEEKYKEENTFYRDLGREISAMRDAKAHLEILDKIKIKYKDKLIANSFHKTENRFKDNLKILEEELNIIEKLNSFRQALEKKQTAIKRWKPENINFEEVENGLKRTYTRGLDALTHVKENPIAHNFHEWRKKVKYTKYHLDFIRYIWPGMMDALKHEFNDLSDLLGDDHDLDNFQMALNENVIEEVEFHLLKAVINEWRHNLEANALELGDKLYAEQPEIFIARINNYYVAHEKCYTAGNGIPQGNHPQ